FFVRAGGCVVTPHILCVTAHLHGQPRVKKGVPASHPSWGPSHTPRKGKEKKSQKKNTKSHMSLSGGASDADDESIRASPGTQEKEQKHRDRHGELKKEIVVLTIDHVEDGSDLAERLVDAEVGRLLTLLAETRIALIWSKIRLSLQRSRNG